MNLGDLKPAKGAVTKRKRIGRGPGSGTGSTSAKGHKGQKSRSGYSSRPWFEGGQMPLQRRVPKRGFTNIHAKPVEIINVAALVGLNEQPVTAKVLKAHGLIRDSKVRLKVLGEGEITEAVTVRAHAFSGSARKKIEAAGGKIEIIEIPHRPKRYRKKNREKK